jgi:DOPA 4,5-dioxygenase
MKIFLPIIILAILGLIASHSTKYNIDRNKVCYDPTPAKIYSWHVHIIYWQHVKSHTDGAYKIRDKFIEHFKDNLAKDECDDLFHNDHFCMFEPDRQPVGPFVTAQWSAYFLPEDFGVVVPWIMQNRGEYDILIHPNTGCELEDHSWWAAWGGKAWPINMDAFGHDEPFPWKEELKNTESLINNEETSSIVKTYLSEYEH